MKTFLKILVFTIFCLVAGDSNSVCKTCTADIVGETCQVTCPNLPRWTVTCACSTDTPHIDHHSIRNASEIKCDWDDVSHCGPKEVEFKTFVITSGILVIVVLFLLGSTIYLLIQNSRRRVTSTSSPSEFTNRTSMEMMEQKSNNNKIVIDGLDNQTNETDDNAEPRYHPSPTNIEPTNAEERGPFPVPRGKQQKGKAIKYKQQPTRFVQIGPDFEPQAITPPPQAPSRRKRNVNPEALPETNKPKYQTLPQFQTSQLDSALPSFSIPFNRFRGKSAGSEEGYDNDPVPSPPLFPPPQLPPVFPPYDAPQPFPRNTKQTDSDSESSHYYEDADPVTGLKQNQHEDEEEIFDN
uniref:uncharacterized protein LOC120330111 n=1 Tax=Styela clava TaxID=7725 RepID=UPI001939B0A2|nr:uncharacterized protein LOC120330111 [Styela clava]